MKQTQNSSVDYDKDEIHHAAYDYGHILDREMHIYVKTLDILGQQTLPMFDAI